MSQATGSRRAAPAGRPAPVPHYRGELVELSGGERVYVASTEPSAIPPAPASGEPHMRENVLCVHGMAGSATNWTELMSLLAPRFACDAVDLPGSGWSPPPARMAGYSIAALTATVIKVIEQRGTGPVHLMGNSMGGLVSVNVAATRPDLVRTLTLISPAMPDRLIHPSHAQFPLLAMPRVGDWLLRKGDAFPAENRVWGVMGMIFYDPGTVHPERVSQAVEEMRRRDALTHRRESLVGAARAITAEYLRPARAHGNAWRVARQVRCPVLAIYGSHDRLVNPRMAGRAARAFADCRVIVLPYTGHVAQMEHPARVAAEFTELTGAARAPRAGTADGRPRQGMPAAPGELDPLTETRELTGAAQCRCHR